MIGDTKPGEPHSAPKKPSHRIHTSRGRGVVGQAAVPEAPGEFKKSAAYICGAFWLDLGGLSPRFGFDCRGLGD